MTDAADAPVEPVASADRHRPLIGVVIVGAFAAVLAIGLCALPRERAELPAIAREAMTIALPQWGTTEPVNEIVYGSRGFDTFGETFLLLAAVVSVMTLGRQRETRNEYVGEASAGLAEQQRDDPHSRTDSEEGEARQAEEREQDDSSTTDQESREPEAAPDDADDDPLGQPAPERAAGMTVIVRVAARTAAVPLSVAAIYLAAWGYSPGGGFPAGAALAGVILLLYTALGHRAVGKVVRPTVLEPLELFGAAAIIAVGVIGLLRRGSLFANWVRLAEPETIRSGGTLQLFSAGELIEVGTGLTIAIFALLGTEHDWTPDESGGDQSSDGSDRSDGSDGSDASQPSGGHRQGGGS
ncbi:MAG: sodium:proton antiporter [Actinobacteria bacterium]|nr:sodium:proton antiporter [Actinomycetota bacterium]